MNPDSVANVNDDGRFLRWVDREAVHRDQMVHRSINILVIHPVDGRLLVQLRNKDKKTYPHFWDISVAGHVDYSDHPNGNPNADMEAFLSAASRELQEEIGVTAPLSLIGKYGPRAGVNYEYTAYFKCESSGPFTLQKEEVAAIRWVNAEELSLVGPRTNQLDWIVATILGWKLK
jgi:isopentenyldiphosphate isomerase